MSPALSYWEKLLMEANGAVKKRLIASKHVTYSKLADPFVPDPPGSTAIKSAVRQVSRMTTIAGAFAVEEQKMHKLLREGRQGQPDRLRPPAPAARPAPPFEHL